MGNKIEIRGWLLVTGLNFAILGQIFNSPIFDIISLASFLILIAISIANLKRK